MTAVYYILGVVVFFASILASIGLHELGHMVPAKAFGGKVTQYFIGFGPTVWSKQVGETEYGVKAIPLGGYVKIVGMLPPAAADLTEPAGVDAQGRPVQRLRKSNTGMFTQLISDARAAEWELIGPDDADRLFYRMPWWKKVIVMAAGPSVNIVIAFVLFSVIYGLYGNGNDVSVSTTVAQVERCVVPPTRADQVCLKGDPDSPAYRAGMRPGDRIVSFNGTPISDYTQLQDLIRGNDKGAAAIGIVRDGRSLTLHTDTLVTPRPVGDNPKVTQPVGYLGILPHAEATKGGPIYTIGQMADLAGETFKALGTLPVKVWGVAQAIVGVHPRAADSPVSIVGGGRMAGEAVSEKGFPLKDKLVFLGGLIAGFNFFIGAFNFVPLLPLDGGHIASALWEAVRRRVARARRRPDPGYVDAAKLLPIAYVVASFLLLMGVVLIIGDLVVPVKLPS